MDLKRARELVGGFAAAAENTDLQAFSIIGHTLIEALVNGEPAAPAASVAPVRVTRSARLLKEPSVPVGRTSTGLVRAVVWCARHRRNESLHPLDAARVIAALHEGATTEGFIDFDVSPEEQTLSLCLVEWLNLANDSKAFREHVDSLCGEATG